ncbi:hypothetical protein ACM66B_002883 [Microbotryomycetes sp. NB124-2]
MFQRHFISPDSRLNDARAASASIERARNQVTQRASMAKEADSNTAQTDSDASSPWTGSSDFDTLSDLDVEGSARATEEPRSPPPPPHSVTRLADTAGHARKQLKRTDTSSTVTGNSRADVSHQQYSARHGPVASRLGGVSPRTVRVEASDDGDDEYSALEDADEMRGRGRGRSRRREEDPVVKRNMLEDALRSSLATLLAFSPHQSLSPAMSSANLVALGATSPRRVSEDASRKLSSLARTSSPFAFALSEDQQDVDETLEMAIFSDSSDNGTQLAPRTTASSSRPIPIKSPVAAAHHHRSSSDSLAERPTTAFSPIASRPLLGPASASPPTWSRQRRRRRVGRRSSLSPAPAATLEERRRARGRGTTDVEESERDQRFMDLVDNARAFMDAPPFVSSSTSASLARTLGRRGSSDQASANASKRGSFAAAPAAPTPSPPEVPPLPANWHQAPLSSPSSASFPSEPAMTSSVPGGELSSSPSRSPDKKSTSRKPKDVSREPLAPQIGWFAWLGRAVELKVWHLVGLCGFAFGFGVSVGARRDKWRKKRVRRLKRKRRKVRQSAAFSVVRKY